MDDISIFHNPSMDTRLSEETSADTIDIETVPPAELTISGVRIIPSFMHFDDAYEGKRFTQKLVIHNCGAHLAFIRLGQPNSRSFEYKSFVDGRYLSPGLKIIRTVTYIHRSSIAVRRGFAPIHINNTQIDYHFFVTLSAAILSLEPEQLDFGRIDAVNVATTRTLYIKNSGSKGTQFAIDLGRNELEITVEPMKGTVPAKSRVALRVELVGSKEGVFLERFWVKCVPPLRAIVTGVFITPKLMVRSFITNLDFTLMQFEPTYYGQRATKPLLIKNSSPSQSMFCVLAEVKGSAMPLEEAERLDENFSNFSLRPTDGRMAADKGSVIQITFSPVKIPKGKSYAACFLKVIRLDCRDVYHHEYEEPLLLYDDSKSRETAMSNQSSLSFDKSFSLQEHFDLNQAGSSHNTQHITFQQAIGICLYGEKETPDVLLRPERLVLKELKFNQSYERELYIENKHLKLPIRLKYCKVASVNVFPKEINLEPSQSKEVKITIKCIQLGDIVKKISFDLLALDYPESVITKVGSVSLKIFYSVDSTVKKPTHHQCLVDYDLSLNLTPDYPYRQSSSEKIKRNNNQNFYLNYIRGSREEREAALPQKPIKDYDVTNPKFLLAQNQLCRNCPPRQDVVTPYTPFIPLTPKQLYNIQIIPKSMKLKKVAPFTVISDHFHLKNENPFPVRIFLTASKPCIVFDNFARYVIGAGENRKINFFFSSFTVGRYYVSINVLVNDSCVFEVTAVATVLPKTVILESHEIDITEADGHFKFINLINGLNSFINYDWDVPDSCFKIFPPNGRIRSGRFLTSVIVYTPRMGMSTITDCTLISESGHSKIVQLSFKRKRPNVTFNCDKIDCGEIPLNIPIQKVIIMTNQKNFKTLYNIPNAYPIPGISITPTEGILDEKDSQVFFVTIRLNAIVKFSTEIIFNLDEETEISIALEGSVNFPKLSLLPNNLYFRRIAPNSFDTLAFKVKNLSNCEFFMTFPLEDFPEFSITEEEEVPTPHLEKIFVQPTQAKVLFLHFNPKHVTTSIFDLPYVINDMLGPPSCNMAATKIFFDEAEQLYKPLENVTIMTTTPKNLPLIRINSSAVDKVLEFSSLTIDFVYFAPDHYANKTVADFTITNTSTDTVKMCIRTDDLCAPFSLTLKSDQEIVFYDVSYLMVLEPKEKIVFEASFNPFMYEKYIVKLPIFLRNYQDNKIFNYLTLRGVYDTPTIITSKNVYHFEPVPARLQNEIRLTLHMNNHFQNCQVFTKTNLHGLSPIFESGRRPKVGKSTLSVLLVHDSMIETCFKSHLYFYCTCEASHTVTVTGVIENCLLTTHALLFLLSEEENEQKERSDTFIIKVNSVINKNTTIFPRFPGDEDDSKYAHYMRSVQKTLEQWVYTQVFYSKQYYKIPEGFIYYTQVTQDTKNRWQKKTTVNDPPLLELIGNLAGVNMKEKLGPSGNQESEKENDILTNLCQTYVNILDYLQTFEIYVPHLKIKYLLNYNQYCLYQKLNKNQYDPPLDEPTFYSYCRQTWVDLIIQCIKFFFYKRMVASTDESIYSEPPPRHERTLSLVSDISTDFDPFQNIQFYGPHEKTLLTWLELCYENARDVLWYREVGRKKEMNNFQTDLRDGLVLGAITARYCPYVSYLIQNMFTQHLTEEDNFHNICILMEAWKLLNFSYKIDPFTFANSSEMEMVLLVTYLYDVLPNCCPQTTITIEASLTQCEKVPVQLQNMGTTPIYYKVLFFGNENDLFRVRTNNEDLIIMVEAGKTKKVMVEYYAKCVMKAKAVILFSGETPGHKYARNIAVEVEGIADRTFTCAEIPLTINLYKPCEININIESPFKKQAGYNLCIGYNEGLYTWEEITKLKICKELFFPEDSIEFDEDGLRTLNTLACCQVQGLRDVWMYFTNPEVGDWGIKLKLTGKLTPDNYEKITILIPENYDNLVCRCKGGLNVTKNCPKIIRVGLSKQNKLLWNARKMMIMECVEEAELQFWRKHIYTRHGTRILALVFSSESHYLRHVVDESIEYNVILGKKCPFVTVDKVVIDDVVSEDLFELPIHPTRDLKAGKSVTVRLETDVNQEKRFYKFSFKAATAKSTSLLQSLVKSSETSDVQIAKKGV